MKKHIASNHEDEKKFQSVPLTDARLELVKEQCGRHSLSEMAKFFPINKTTLKNQIDKQKVEFPKSPFGSPCNFCKNENSPHEKKSVFKCDVCSKNFPKMFRLRDHVKSVHGETKPFKCKSCPSIFGQKNILAKHIKLL